MITFFTFLSFFIVVTQTVPLKNPTLISPNPNNNVSKISWRAPRFKRQFGGCGQYCCCAAFCCCSPPPVTLPPTTTHLPIPRPQPCCQISQRICCQPPPLIIQPPPVCCTQIGQMLMPQQQQQLIPAPQPMIGQGAAMPMIGQGAAMQLPPQIGRPMCCPCFGNGRKRRSLYFLQHKHAKSNKTNTSTN